MRVGSILKYWGRFIADPGFQEDQPWMQPVMRFFGILHPNVWTCMRFPSGVLIVLLYRNQEYLWAALAFIFFTLTDWADGKSAYINNKKTKLGGVLDGTADKFHMLPILWQLFCEEFIPSIESEAWQKCGTALFWTMIASEASRLFLPLSKRFDRAKGYSANMYGKWKFGTQIIFAILLSFVVFVFPEWSYWVAFVFSILAIATFLSILSVVCQLYPELEKYAGVQLKNRKLS